MRTKTRRRFLGILLSAVMLLTCAVPALAQDSARDEQPVDSVTVPSEPNYQITGSAKVDLTQEDLEDTTPPASPTGRYNVWYKDSVTVEMPVRANYEARWGLSNNAVSTAASETGDCRIDTLTVRQYLRVELRPAAGGSGETYYGLYVLEPFSFTGVALKTSVSSDEEEGPLNVPYGTPLTLTAEVVLRDSSGQPVPLSEGSTGTMICGRTATFAWTKSLASGSSEPVEGSEPSIEVDTLSPDAVASGSVTYTCTVSGLPIETDAASFAASKSVTVQQPQMGSLNPVVEAQVGGDPIPELLSWNGSVSPNLKLNGDLRVQVTKQDAGAPGLECTVTPDGVLVSPDAISANDKYTVGQSFRYDLKLMWKDQQVGIGRDLTLVLVPKAPKVTSVSAVPKSAAAGQAVELSGTVANIETPITFEWVEREAESDGAWQSLDCESAAGTLNPGDQKVPSFDVYPETERVYALRLGDRDPSTETNPAEEVYVDVFTLAPAGDTSFGAITGLQTPLGVEWKPIVDQENGPVAPANPPRIDWVPAGVASAAADSDLDATVTLPVTQSTVQQVEASYAPDDEGMEETPVEFAVTPVTLTAGNGGTTYTFADDVPVSNPVNLPLAWSSVPRSWTGVKIHWTLEKPAASSASAPTSQLEADGTVSEAAFTPDVPGQYVLTAAAYTGRSYSSARAVGGTGVSFTLTAAEVRPGSSRIVALDGTHTEINEALRFQAQTANSSGLYEDIVSASAGTWTVQLPNGTSTSVRPGSNGQVRYSPSAPGTYTVTYTPAAAGALPATIQFTAVDPDAPELEPEITLTVLQQDAPARSTVAPGTNLTAVIAVRNLPVSVTSVEGLISPFGFETPAPTAYRIAAENGSGQTSLTYTVPTRAESGSPLRLTLRTAVADVDGVSIRLPSTGWSSTVASNKLSVHLSAPAKATVNQPFTVSLEASQALNERRTAWTLSMPGLTYSTSSDNNALTFTPTRTGHITVSVSAENAKGDQTDSASIDVLVVEELVVTLRGPERAGVGEKVTMTAVPSTSSENVVLAWTLDPEYPYSISGRSITFEPDETGTVNVSVAAVLGTLTADASTSVAIGTEPSPSASAGASPSAEPSSSASPSAEPSSSASPGPDASASASPSASPSADASATASSSPKPSGTVDPSYPLQLRASSRLQLEYRDGILCIIGIPIARQVSERMSVAELKREFQPVSGATLRVVNQNGVEQTDTEAAVTGTVVRLENGDGTVIGRATVLITGDVLGSGLINIAQLVRLAQDLNKDRVLIGVFELAGDITRTGEINIVDLVKEAQLLHPELDS